MVGEYITQGFWMFIGAVLAFGAIFFLATLVAVLIKMGKKAAE